MISNGLYFVGLIAFGAGTLVDIFIENRTEHTAHLLDLVGLALLVGSVVLEISHAR